MITTTEPRAFNVPQRLHNAKRAFQRAIVTADLQQANAVSGRLLERYTQGLPDNSGGLRCRAQISEMAAAYLDRCRQHARRRVPA